MRFQPPLGLSSEFCCSFFFFYCKPIQGLCLVTGHYATEEATRRLSFTNPHPLNSARPISYHKQQLHHYHPITDRGIKCRRVLKGIIWAILGVFFTTGRLEWESGARRVQCGCPLWLTAALHSVVGGGERREEEQEPKTDMLSSAWMPSNHSSSLPLFGAVPPPSTHRRDPLCNPY